MTRNMLMPSNSSSRIARRASTCAALCIFLFILSHRAQAAPAVNPTTAPAEVTTPEPSLTQSLNFVWTLLAGFLVMFMQSGFALVETGMCRAKNAANTMSMNFLVYPLAMAGFFVCGFAFMFGGINGVPAGHAAPPIGGPPSLGLQGAATLNHMFYLTLGGKPWGLLGLHGFFLSGSAYDPRVAVMFLYMMVFMDTTATIPTGACAERWRFKSFTLFSFCVGAFIYSFYGCWMWGGGWLAQLGINAGLGHGAVDFAGSSVVHLQGGMLGLVMAWMLGPRLGKYDPMGNPRPIFGHHMPMVMFGTLLLAFGWFGFNAGSTLSATNGSIGQIAINTMLASGAATLSAAFFMWKFYGKPDPSMMCNGMLGGLVAITAPCAFISPFIAFLIGAIAGVLVVWSVLFWERRGIDDPVGAISVHGVGGLWGLLAVGLFANGTFGAGEHGVAGNVKGLFYGSPGQLLAQVIAAVTCIAWNLVAGGAVFYAVGRLTGGNRVPPEIELAGLDIPEMGAPGYPEFITQISQEQITASEIAAVKSKYSDF
jgi:Amt family ammonium transporter